MITVFASLAVLYVVGVAFTSGVAFMIRRASPLAPFIPMSRVVLSAILWPYILVASVIDTFKDA